MGMYVGKKKVTPVITKVFTGGKSREIVVPVQNIPEFQSTSVTIIYTFIINPDKILVSSNASRGLWEYTVSTGEFYRVHTSGAFSKFQLIDEFRVLASASSGTTIVFDTMTRTAVTQYTGEVLKITKLGDKIQLTIQNSSNFYIFDTLTNAFVTIRRPDGNYIGAVLEVNSTTHDALVFGSSNNNAVYLYRNSTNEVISVGTFPAYMDRYSTIYTAESEKYFIIGSSNPYVYGFHIFDKTNEIFKHVGSNLSYGLFYYSVHDDLILASSYASSSGVWMYTPSTGDMTQIISSATFSNLIKINNKVFIFGTSRQWYAFDLSTKECLLISNVYLTNPLIVRLTDQVVLVSNSANVLGLYALRDTETPVEQIVPYGQNWDNIEQKNGEYIITSGSNFGKYRVKYNPQTDEFVYMGTVVGV